MATLTNVKKEKLYKLYIENQSEPKEYAKINRKQLAKEMQKIYTPEYIMNLCTMRELIYLENQDTEDLFAKNTLEDKFLLIDNEIPEELEQVVAEVLSSVNKQDKEESDKEIIKTIGFVRVMGECTEDELHYMQHDDSIVKLPIFKYYIVKQKDGTETKYIYKNYLDVIGDLRTRKHVRNIDRFHRLSEETYISYFYNGYDIKNHTVAKFFSDFFDDFSEEPNKDIAINAIMKSALCDTGRGMARAILSSYDCASEGLIKSFNNAMNLMPSGALGGYTPYDLDPKKEKNTYIPRKRRGALPQDNALISPKDTRNFLKLYFNIIDFVNKKYNMYPGLGIQNTNTVLMIPLADIAMKFWSNAEEILDEYCKANPLKLSQANLEVVRNFKNGVRKKFCVYALESEYAAFVDKEKRKTYMVKGLADKVDHIISNNELPLMVQTSLVPFHGDIVYGGVMEICIDEKHYLDYKKVFEKESRIYTL